MYHLGVTTKANIYKPPILDISMEQLPITNQARKILITIIVGVLVIVFAILTSIFLNFSLVGNLVMSWILTALYALFAFFMVDPIVKVNPTRIIEKPVVEEIIQIVEKPIVKEIQIPMENRVIEVVEKPVIKEVIREVPVEKVVYRTIERKHKSLNIPKFDFIGSTQTRTYHKRTCKFSKMLKKKFKLHSNSRAFFKRKHFRACKTCLKK